MYKNVIKIAVSIIVITVLISIIFYNVQLNKIEKHVQLNHFGFSDSSELSDHIRQSEVYLVGEVHGTSENMSIELVLLEYMVNHRNVKYYIGEFPPSIAFLLNTYLASDTISLDIIMNAEPDLSGNSARTASFQNKWEAIKRFNDQLSENEKITVIGIDVEPSYSMAFAAIDLLLGSSYSELAKEEQQLEVSTLMHSENLIVKDICVKLEQGNLVVPISSFRKRYNLRDEFMYQNFTTYKSEIDQSNDANKSFFGQFGNLHVYKSKDNGVNWLASRIKEDKSQIDIVTIVLEYYESYRLNKQFEKTKIHNVPIDVHKLTPKKYVLVELNEDQFPFDKYAILGDLSFLEPSAKYFDYVIILRDSEADTVIINGN